MDKIRIDDLSLMYAAVYSDFEMSELLAQTLPHVAESEKVNAIYYAAMGMKEELLSLDSRRHQKDENESR